MSDERTIQCIGTTRQTNEPVKFDIRVKSGGGIPCDYRISIDEAIQLRRELTDFLANQNVPTTF
jgi:hypothetical protein